MISKKKIPHDKTSTPKRRRLGTSRILRPNLQVFSTESNGLHSSNSGCCSPRDANDDPPLPCNQIEYLCDSGDTSSASNEVPCSPGVLDDCIMRDAAHWESLVIGKPANKSLTTRKELDEVEGISDEMFHSKLEQECSQLKHIDTSFSTRICEKQFRERIESSFDAMNQSVDCGLPNKTDRSSLFETNDSFLLDVKESGILLEEKVQEHDMFSKPKTYNNHDSTTSKSFYGLPMETKELFKTYRNIEKFYEWQEECLRQRAVVERRNLVYALPTSGGKTLVAEVLLLREVLLRRKNALFILPFVAIVQEKIFSLSPFAVKLGFLVEEYTGGRGHIPPKRRRQRSSVYVATIEKGLALVRSLLELGRLEEIGLIVVDELHLIGEPGRGAALEMLLTTVMFTSKSIQIVGMSATIGNLPDVARFLRADVYQRDFRPVELTEYVKRGDRLFRLRGEGGQLELEPDRVLAYDYSSAGSALDPDRLGGLVAEAGGPVLVFCPTQRNAENVAALLARLQRREQWLERRPERQSLAEALRACGAGLGLCAAAARGLAFHHAGLSFDERALIENAFRSGVVTALCCTMTLAAGVNLPARRVIVRAPRVGRQPLSLAAYRQMAGRAGRAGHCQQGESILVCGEAEWAQVVAMLRGGLGAARSVLAPQVPALLLSAVALGAANTRHALTALLATTLLARTGGDDGLPVDLEQLCEESVRSLVQSGVLEEGPPGDVTAGGDSHRPLVVSALGQAAIKGCMDVPSARRLRRELALAARALVLAPLHLLYLVAPHDPAVRPDYAHYYSLYCALDDEGERTARVLGITEVNAIRMATGKAITNVPEEVLIRFYVALMLYDLWKQVPFPEVAEKYGVSRGLVQALLAGAAAAASGAARFADALGLWPWAALLSALAPRLQTCAAPDLAHLMELPSVKKARALQLSRAGFKRVEDLARASAEELATRVDHLSRSAAHHLISAARMMLIEKVENLRAEAEDVMEGLNL